MRHPLLTLLLLMILQACPGLQGTTAAVSGRLPLISGCSSCGEVSLRRGLSQQMRSWEQKSDTVSAAQEYVWHTVTRVIDGDTFRVDDGAAGEMTVRLIGIDAPETQNRGARLKGYYADESALYLKKLIEGKRVRLEYDVGRYDRYRRTLAYVFLENGTFVNAEMVRKGYATVMTVPPNVRYAGQFTELAAKARKRNRGLWKEPPAK